MTGTHSGSPEGEAGPQPRVSPRPLDPSQRLLSLDVLRGIAVLGILPINVQGFAMPVIAMTNPTAFGSLDGAHGAVFRVAYVLADQEFLTLFAMLFAAGNAMVCDRIEREGGRAGVVHLRRTLVLLAIGCVHAYGFWELDVLVPFAQCALVVWLAHRLPAARLLVLGALVYSVHSLLGAYQGLTLDRLGELPRALAESAWYGDPRSVAAEVAAYRGGFIEQLEYRAPHVWYSHTTRLLTWTPWRIGGAMLLGLGLYRLGVLTGERSRRFYGVLAVAGLGVGLTLRLVGMERCFDEGWTLSYARWFGYQYVYWGSLASALGWIGAVTWWVQGGHARVVCERLACVGRLTLSNYLAQSLLCGLIFYGHGLGLYGSVGRVQLLLVVFAVWSFQVAASLLWLRAFRFGPAETLWRFGSYGRLPAVVQAGSDADS